MSEDKKGLEDGDLEAEKALNEAFSTEDKIEDEAKVKSVSNEELSAEEALNAALGEDELSDAAKIIKKEVDIAVNREEIKQEEIKVEGRLFYYVKTILGGVVDQISAMGLALILYMIIDLALPLAGFEIVESVRSDFFLIVYIITNVLYYPLIQEVFDGKTLGKKIMTR